jgi:thiosulfate/3-mercaptopyruvate sulfurtransferase
MSSQPNSPYRFVLPPLVATVFLFAGCQKKTGKSEPAKGEVPKGATAKVDLRVRVDELKGMLKDPKLRILDVRSKENYDRGHVPGAVRVDVAKWKDQALKDEGKGLGDKNGWQQLARAAGINDLAPIVVYSDSPTNAARIWWTLKYLGAETVGILDGGWKLWLDQRGEKATSTPEVKPGDFTVEFKADRLAVIDALKKDYKSADMQIVDARSNQEFASGTVPNAVHVEWKGLMNADGTLKSDAELKKIFAGRKLAESKRTVTYCQSGGRAALDAYALEVAGFKNVQNYYCSWQQWSRDKSAPVEARKKE